MILKKLSLLVLASLANSIHPVQLATKTTDAVTISMELLSPEEAEYTFKNGMCNQTLWPVKATITNNSASSLTLDLDTISGKQLPSKVFSTSYWKKAFDKNNESIISICAVLSSAFLYGAGLGMLEAYKHHDVLKFLYDHKHSTLAIDPEHMATIKRGYTACLSATLALYALTVGINLYNAIALSQTISETTQQEILNLSAGETQTVWLFVDEIFVKNSSGLYFDLSFATESQALIDCTIELPTGF